MHNSVDKKLYNSENFQLVKNINPYLIDAPDIFGESRKNPIYSVKVITDISIQSCIIISTSLLQQMNRKKKIEQTAQMILDARAKYPDCSLADLYDELIMSPELCKAHQANDLAVMETYGFDKNITESECVAELIKLYQKFTDK